MTLEVLDWRRQVADLYREVRGSADPEAAHALWCAERQRLISGHPASPNPRSVLRHARYDPGLRFEVAVDRDVEPARLELPTGTDGVVPFERIGRVDLDDVGSLDVWWLDSYGGGVWLPMRDQSDDSYGGGRYVLDTVKGADLGSVADRLVIDLNFAYNPSCAYAEHWACPLAPPGNRLDVAVRAGELAPAAAPD
jgi:uncharacterized protein (DUF1684 family)